MAKFIVANWKMNPRTVGEAVALAEASDREGLIIAPPFPFLPAVGAAIKKSSLGAQDLFFENAGAFTGEVSAPELVSLGVKYVIVGHSERRKLGETDELVAKKTAAALKNGITPILCVGETKEERDAGRAKEVVARQLKIGFSLAADGSLPVPIIAYEPVWAIGTGTPDTPENMVAMAGFIRESLAARVPRVSVLYGGSVTAENAERYLMREEVSGALVGGASLAAFEIIKIVEIGLKYH